LKQEIQFKYGFHFIWPNVLVDLNLHKKFVFALIERAKTYEGWDSLKNVILKHNDWTEIFDTTIFQSVENGLR